MVFFFVVLNKHSRPFESSERDAFAETVARHSYIRDHVNTKLLLSPRPDLIVLAVSNRDEPIPSFEDDDRSVLCSGLVADPDHLAALRPNQDFVAQVTRCAGRFSALCVDKRTGGFSLAVPTTRSDPIFFAENAKARIWGTQASTVARLCHGGKLRYAPENLATFISKGYFGDNATAFRDVVALPSLTTVHSTDARVSTNSMPLWHLKKKSADMDLLTEELAGFYRTGFAAVSPEQKSMTISLRRRCR